MPTLPSSGARANPAPTHDVWAPGAQPSRKVEPLGRVGDRRPQQQETWALDPGLLDTRTASGLQAAPARQTPPCLFPCPPRGTSEASEGQPLGGWACAVASCTGLHFTARWLAPWKATVSPCIPSALNQGACCTLVPEAALKGRRQEASPPLSPPSPGKPPWYLSGALLLLPRSLASSRSSEESTGEEALASSRSCSCWARYWAGVCLARRAQCRSSLCSKGRLACRGEAGEPGLAVHGGQGVRPGASLAV